MQKSLSEYRIPGQVNGRFPGGLISPCHSISQLIRACAFGVGFSVFVAVVCVCPVTADEVKLKNGETVSGRITYEGSDILKVEVSVSSSIKETKIISRADIAEVVKDAPDVVEYNRIEKLVPTASLMEAESYRQILETGPVSFLRSFPNSSLAPKVEEIRAVLAEELDKVERGYLKLEGDWISPQEQIDFKDLVDSRVRFLRMEYLAQSANYNSLIGAMREFEVIEENYLGSPAFPRALELALKTIPTLGAQLQTMLRNVDYKNTEYERSLEASTPEARELLSAAKAKEEKAFQDAVANEKKAGIKWIQLNPGVRASIEEYLKLSLAELNRLREYDPELLRAQAEKLVEVDKLIAANNIAEARSKLAEAAAMTGQKTDTKTSTKSKTKSTASPGSYIAALNAKISDRLAEEQAKAKAKEAAAKSEALAANLKSSSEGKEGAEATVEASETGDSEAWEAGQSDMPEKESPEVVSAPEIDEFSALSGGKKKTESVTDAKKPLPKKSPAKEDEPGEDLAPVVIEEEGGFPLSLIAPILTVLIIVAVVILKVMGIGGKKGGEE